MYGAQCRGIQCLQAGETTEGQQRERVNAAGEDHVSGVGFEEFDPVGDGDSAGRAGVGLDTPGSEQLELRGKVVRDAMEWVLPQQTGVGLTQSVLYPLAMEFFSTAGPPTQRCSQ